MTTGPHVSPATIVPTLRYGDVPRAIDWLCDAFGFEKHLVVSDEDDSVLYAELTIGSSMIMVGPAQGSAFDRLMKQPDQIGGSETQICYLYVADADAHRDRAAAAGAEILLDINGEGSKGRGYSCRDPEGHIWNFGTYNPWQAHERSVSSRRKRRTLLASIFLLLLAPIAAGLLFGLPEQVLAQMETAGLAWPERGTSSGDEYREETRRQLALAHAAKEASERALRVAEEQLAFERNARELADRSLKAAQDQLAKERGLMAGNGNNLREELDRERSARAKAEKAAGEMREQLAQARLAKESVDRTLLEVQTQLAKSNTARLTAERVSKEAREQAAKEQAANEQAELQAREAAYRAAKAAARERMRRWRAANEPSIHPPVPSF